MAGEVLAEQGLLLPKKHQAVSLPKPATKSGLSALTCRCFLGRLENGERFVTDLNSANFQECRILMFPIFLDRGCITKTYTHPHYTPQKPKSPMLSA